MVENILPIERQQQILTWLEKEAALRVSEISKRLDVSEMTVYRDIKPLIEQQKVLKTVNGITLVPQKFDSSHCAYCFKNNSNSRFAVQLIKLNGQIEHTCCSHCGLLRYKEIENEVSQIICRDFLFDTTMSGKTSIFLLNADIHLNCCQPQVIPFGSLQHAKKFQMGFGGELCTFVEAIEAINLKMSGGGSCQT